MKRLDRDKTIDALVAEILGADDKSGARDIFTDALINGRIGFLKMPDDDLQAACDLWNVAPVYQVPKPAYQPKTGARCACKPGVQRDNCPECEGTGWRIDFAAIRGRR